VAAILETMQRRVQRPMLDLKDAIRSVLDGVRNGVTVGGTEDQGAKNQHVERALEHVARIGPASSRHGAEDTPLEHLWE
jgi:hypothetical protein